METGYRVNLAREKLVEVLMRVLPLTRGGAEEIVEPLIELLDAAIPMQSVNL